jgi:HK97 gp10 family phage protein
VPNFTFRTTVRLNNFPAIKVGMETRAEAFTAKAALDIQGVAMTMAPVDTGFLKNSIQSHKIGPAHWRVTVGAEYGIYLEFGTRFMGAQPYFFPAVAQVSPSFIAAMRRITG